MSQEHLKPLHKLRVLKLVVARGERYDPDGRITQEAADKIFEILGSSCPHLTVVVFEFRLHAFLNPAWSFVRSKEIGRAVQAKCLGMNVAPHMIRDYEPCSDIFEPEKLIFS